MPMLIPPPGSCDCHMHVYGEGYPILPTWTAVVPVATPAEYLQVQRELGLQRIVVVQPNAYGFDNRCTLDAIATFGAQARGVANLPPDVTDAELQRLHAAGVRGVRLHMIGNSLYTWDDVKVVAARAASMHWHVQVQLDGRKLPEVAALLRALPAPVVIDHNGKFLEPVAEDDPAFVTLLRLMDTGHFYVKMSAVYETSKTGAPRYEDVSVLARALARNNPDRCLWASNWPHPGIVKPPTNAAMLDLLLDWVPDEAARHKVLVDNPARLYDF